MKAETWIPTHKVTAKIHGAVVDETLMVTTYATAYTRDEWAEVDNPAKDLSYRWECFDTGWRYQHAEIRHGGFVDLDVVFLHPCHRCYNKFCDRCEARWCQWDCDECRNQQVRM